MEPTKEEFVRFICDNDLPWQLVKKKSFQRLWFYGTQVVGDIPGPDAVKATASNMYREVQRKLIEMFANVHNVSLTVDAWTSRNNITLLGVTAHWIDVDWKLCELLLAIRQIKESHCGTNLYNNICTLRNSRFTCESHRQRYTRVHTTMEKYVDMCKMFELPNPIKIKVDYPTRWNSTFKMLEHALAKREEDWELIEEYLCILGPLCEGSDYVCSTKRFSITKVTSLISALKSQLEQAMYSTGATLDVEWRDVLRSACSAMHNKLMQYAKELDKYLNIPCSEEEDSPLSWWKDVRTRYFPNWTKIASQFLAVSPTSALVERLFSVGRGITTYRRGHLDAESIEMLMMLRAWFRRAEQCSSDSEDDIDNDDSSSDGELRYIAF
ncbi:putative transcriptional regulator tpeD [Wolffia australiana]